MKKLLSVILCLSIILSLCCYSVSATVDFSYKIDEALAEKLESMDDDDTIDVSIWFTDIDYDALYSQAKEKLTNKIRNNEISDKSIDLLNESMRDLSNKAQKTQISELISHSVTREFNDIDLLRKEIDNSVNTEDSNIVLKTMREVSSNMIRERLTVAYNEIFENADINNFIDILSNKKVIFASKYAPMISINLTKKDIYSVVNNHIVDAVYTYVEPKIIECDTTTVQADDNPSFSDVISRTGVYSAKQVFGVNGNGIKIGIYDNFAKPTVADYLDYSKIHYLNELNYNEADYRTDKYTEHGSIMTSIIQGYTDAFTDERVFGVAHEADIYWATSAYAGVSVYDAIEAFLGKNCNIFCLSLGFGYGSEEAPIYNEYMGTALYFDYIVNTQKLHFVSCSSNTSCDTIASGNMAYNGILVGNCDIQGNIVSGGNNYVLDSDAPYKPDLVSPFHNVELFHESENVIVTKGGTSYGTPTVTGALALAFQMSETLKLNPALAKSALLAATKVSDAMIETEDMLTTDTNRIALNHEYGAGVLNALNLCDIADSGYYATGILSSNNSSDTFTVNYNGVAVMDGYRFALCWDKVNVDNGNYNFTSSALDKIYLKITTPSGSTYTSDYQYDNKQMVSFNVADNVAESGTYTIEVGIISATSSMINYGVSYYRGSRIT